MNKAFSKTLLCASTLFLISAISLEAQSAPEISAVVGAMQYSQSASSSVPMMGLRAAFPLRTSWLLGEGNLTFASLREPNLAIGTRAGVAEGQLQFQVPFARVRPYLGVGAGWFHYFASGVRRAETSPTFSVAGGLRARLSGRFGASAELRVRGWNYQSEQPDAGFHRSAAEWTAGWTYAL
jgi:hypothetical protein